MLLLKFIVIFEIEYFEIFFKDFCFFKFKSFNFKGRMMLFFIFLGLELGSFKMILI